MIDLIFPDGSSRQFPPGTSGRDVAASISPSLAKRAVLIKLDGRLLDLEGIAVRAGHHCAQPILRRFGLEKTVRATLALYNTKEDLDALVAALQRIQAGRTNS